jgi:hypothetical protein
MPLSGDSLGLAMIAAMDAYVGGLAEPKNDNYDRTQAFKELGKAIVNYIVANAQVTVNVTSVSLVQPGVGVSGPGTGTGTII